jgi:PHD/YefM family antitoxin component YafN of YafNO toxin-antitoxin module
VLISLPVDKSLEETLEITRDPALLASIARSRAESKAGKRTPLADILAE